MAKRRTPPPESGEPGGSPSAPESTSRPRARARSARTNATESAGLPGDGQAPAPFDPFAARPQADDRSTKPSDRTTSRASDEEIRVRAYYRYLERGRTDGLALEDWVIAEQELTSGPQQRW
jgi:hypothetical protein